MRCATKRATMSVVPPAGNGTIIRIGLLGKACDWAACQGTMAMKDTAAMPGARAKTRLASIFFCLQWISFPDQAVAV